MPVFTMTCPGCQTALRVATAPRGGGVIRCPSCAGLFRLWGTREEPPASPPFRGAATEPDRDGSSVYRMGRSLSPQAEPEQTQPGRLDPGAAPRPRARHRLRSIPRRQQLPPANHFVLVACGVMLIVALLAIGLLFLLATTMPATPDGMPSPAKKGGGDQQIRPR
jgi:hypothetical protein